MTLLPQWQLEGAIHKISSLEGAILGFSKTNDTTPAFLYNIRVRERQLVGAIHKLLLLGGVINELFKVY